jgi:hypothetical protein
VAALNPPNSAISSPRHSPSAMRRTVL